MLLRMRIFASTFLELVALRPDPAFIASCYSGQSSKAVSFLKLVDNYLALSRCGNKLIGDIKRHFMDPMSSNFNLHRPGT